MSKETKKVSIPVSVFNSMLKAQKSWEEFIDELEDFLLSKNEGLIGKMKEARKEHLGDDLENFSKLKVE